MPAFAAFRRIGSGSALLMRKSPGPGSGSPVSLWGKMTSLFESGDTKTLKSSDPPSWVAIPDRRWAQSYRVAPS
jgi:hypothetical protein